MKPFGKITFLGGAGSATGSHFLFESHHRLFAIDCGLFQGDRFAMKENEKPFPYDVSKLRALIVTHAHMDHIGRIPRLVMQGFRGAIYSTPETKEIAQASYEDAIEILEKEAREDNRSPLYSKTHVDEAMRLWKGVSYHTRIIVSENISFELKDAGHILGSAIVEFSILEGEETKKVVFTGDLGNSPSPILRDTEIINDAEYMVIESVYGNRNHEPKESRDQKLKAILKEAVSRGGAVIIPTFSVERTQVVLYELNRLVENGELSNIPVFLDSPLALRITQIYEKSRGLFNDVAREEMEKGDDLFSFKGLKVIHNTRESKAIHGEKNSKIIIAGSGMSIGGRVISHERFYLDDPNATILFVGYQAVGSLGRRIADGEKNVEIEGQKIKITAHIEKIDGYSAHKDMDHLVEFVSHSAETLKKVFVCMGEPKSESFLAQRIRDYVGIETITPEAGSNAELV